MILRKAGSIYNIFVRVIYAVNLLMDMHIYVKVDATENGMAITYNYNPDKDILYGSMEGSVTVEELQFKLMEITESSEFQPNVKTLWDLRKLDFSQLGWSFGKQLVMVRDMNPKRGDAKIAIITNEGISFGMGEMYKVQSTDLPQKMMVFSDYQAGEEWLFANSEIESEFYSGINIIDGASKKILK